MKHRVADLEDALLDLAVAKAAGLVPVPKQPPGYFYWEDAEGHPASGWWAPSRYWSEGGPIIERERITLDSRIDEYCAYYGFDAEGRTAVQALQRGPTMLVAAMRSYVARKFGKEVDLP